MLRTEAHSNEPSRNSPENWPNPVLGFFGEYCAIVSKTNPATLIAVGITPGDVPRRGGTQATTGLGRRIENGVQIIPRLTPKTFRAGTSASLSRASYGVCLFKEPRRDSHIRQLCGCTMLLMAPETLPWWSELSSEEAWNDLVVIRCHSSFSEFSKLNWRLGRKLM